MPRMSSLLQVFLLCACFSLMWPQLGCTHYVAKFNLKLRAPCLLPVSGNKLPVTNVLHEACGYWDLVKQVAQKDWLLLWPCESSWILRVVVEPP